MNVVSVNLSDYKPGCRVRECDALSWTVQWSTGATGVVHRFYGSDGPFLASSPRISMTGFPDFMAAAIAIRDAGL